MSREKYSVEDYTNAYDSLTNEQKDFLDNFISKGYRTRWLYVFARNKGLISEELNVEDGEELEGLNKEIEWSLINYRDYLSVNNEVRCECGRALRHAYTVVHVPTGEVQTLGSNHFIQHTNISPNDVKEILRNFRKIDLEKVEILEKVIEGRDIDTVSKVNRDFIFPKDIAKQVEINLPLLDRQINRLRKLGAFSDYEEDNTKRIYDSFNREINEKQNSSLVLFSKNHSKDICNDLCDNNIFSKPNFEIEISEMLNKLESNPRSVEQAEKYLNYLRYYENSIDPQSVDKKKVEIIFIKILGGLSSGQLRNKLVDIENILKRIYARQFRK